MENDTISYNLFSHIKLSMNRVIAKIYKVATPIFH